MSINMIQEVGFELVPGMLLRDRMIRRVTLRSWVRGNIRTAHTTYAAALKTTTHPKTRCRKSYAAT